MKLGAAILALLVIAVAAPALWVRLAPSDPARWHRDPAAAQAGTQGRRTARPTGGDQPVPIFPGPPERLLSALDRIAMADPRTRRLAGSVEEGRITYVTRSRLWGFPDYTTVGVQKVEGGTAPVILARQRFGRSDFGVNRARVRRWLAALSRSGF